jgi:hypothetical protein
MTGDEYDSTERERPLKDKSTEDLLQGEADAVQGFLSDGDWGVIDELAFRLLGRHPMMDETGEDPAYWSAVSHVMSKILTTAAYGMVHIPKKDEIRDFFTGEVIS